MKTNDNAYDLMTSFRNAGGSMTQDPTDGQRRDLTVRSFQLRAETINADERSVEAVIATEAPTLVLDMQRWEVVEEILLASGMRVASADGQVPLLDTHNRATVQAQLGSCRDIRVDGDVIIGRNVFSSVQAAQDCFTKITEGHVRDNSVGYQVENFVTIEAGQTVEVEGRSFTASEQRPLRVTTDWVIKENSVCPIGADSNAKMRGESRTAKSRSASGTPGLETQTQTYNRNHNKTGATTMLRNYLISLGMRADATEEEMQAFIDGLTDEQRSAMPAADDTPQPKPATPRVGMTEADRAAIAAQVRAEHAAAIAEENQRCTAIRNEGREHGVEGSVIERCIAEGLDISAARGEFLKAIRNARPAIGAGVNISSPARDITREHLAISLLRQGGAREDQLRNHYGEDVVSQSAERVGFIGLQDICRMGLALAGHDVPLQRDEMIRAGFSTGTLPNILGDVAHKMLLKGFMAAGATWERWCSVKNVSDFKANNLVRLNLNGRLEKIGNGGEISYAERSEEKRSVQADEYGKILTITRKDLINDDAGTFMEAAEKMGKKANQAVSDLVYTVLLANVLNDGSSTALFSTSAHTDFDSNAIVNLQASSALAIATLTSAISLFRKFREYNGDPIDVDPYAILCPPELEGTANALVSSEMIVSGNTTSQPAVNPNARYRLEVISESRLSNSRFTGYSTTSWYLVPAAGDVDLVSVAFLNGNRMPSLSQFDMIDRSGVGWKILHDFGAAATDIYGVKSTA